ncbi:hypothetical protein [Xanthomonas medicagonis]|uniref:hypothetical protein n=1 Tax=Xanthomonas medicagonis TaxID=3160841 RepID=UPI00351513DA
MSRYCSYCGLALQQVGDFRSQWLTVYACPSGAPLHAFVEVGDARRVFPLLDLSAGVKDRLLGAEPSLVQLAVSRIRMIDYKTVSIVGFEQTLLGLHPEDDDAAT